VHFDDTRLPPAIDLAVAIVPPGATVSPPPKGTLWGRVAYATVVAATMSQVQAALDDTGAALQLTVGAEVAPA
jgi:hypothetical protein